MSRTHSTLQGVEREAVDWLQKLTSGEMTPQDAAALKLWRERSSLHEAAFVEAKQLWRTAGIAGHVMFGSGEGFEARLDALGLRRRTMNRRAMLGGGVAALAAASAFAVIRPPFALWPSLSELNSDYRTGTGEQRRVTFSGDVAISLNTQTSLAVRSAKEAENRIELIAGEASFSTSTQAARSLVVLAADGSASASSGHFDVRYTAHGERSPVSVTCLEGAVRVERGNDVTDLQPGQRVHYHLAGVGQIAAVDPQAASEWQRGFVEFRGTPIAEVVEEINRYRPGRIILMNPDLGQKQVSGRFRIDQMNEALSGLKRAFGAKLRQLPGGIVLLS